MANEYATRADLKLRLGIEVDDDSRDTLLDGALAASSRGIDTATGRRFWLDAEPSARVFYARWERDVWGQRDTPPHRRRRGSPDARRGRQRVVVDTGDGLRHGPRTTRSCVAVPSPLLALAAGGWGGGPRARVTARWGWPVMPDEITEATLIQAARLYRRKDSPEGVTGSAEWGVVRLSRRDPDVWALIEHFIRPGFG